MKTKNLLFVFFVIINYQLSIINCFAQGTWTQKANFGGTARSGAVGFSIGTKGYIGTGDSGVDFWEWDQATNIWTQKADFGGAARENASGFSIGSKGYIGLGEGSNLFYNDFWEWDQTTNIWTQKANFAGMIKWGAASFSIATKGYIGTGIGGNYQNASQYFWEWDQTANTWTQKANFAGKARYLATGFSIGTNGYIGLGFDSATQSNDFCTNDFWEWNQPTNTWAQKANFGGAARAGAVGFSINGKGYMGIGSTGLNTYSAFQDFWEWDPNTNIWIQQAAFGGTARSESVGFSVGTKGYIGIGVDFADNPQQDFWEFNPSASAGIQETNASALLNLTVYPNPTNNTITVKFNAGLKNANPITIAIKNSVGETVYSETVNDGSASLTINVAALPKGIYFIELLQGNNRSVKKLVLQ